MNIQEKSQLFINDLYYTGGASMVGKYFKNVDIEWYMDNILKLESSAVILAQSFFWSETPEGNDVWLKIYEELVQLHIKKQQ
jgi:hypothetical protein